MIFLKHLVMGLTAGLFLGIIFAVVPFFMATVMVWGMPDSGIMGVVRAFGALGAVIGFFIGIFSEEEQKP